MTLFSKEYCYLSPEAKSAHAALIAMGFDEDLAYALLEVLGGESIYDLEDDDERL